MGDVSRDVGKVRWVQLFSPLPAPSFYSVQSSWSPCRCLDLWLVATAGAREATAPQAHSSRAAPTCFEAILILLGVSALVVSVQERCVQRNWVVVDGAGCPQGQGLVVPGRS